ncbi:hypothetical protein TNCV_3297521 [Trichonephila clavipes]|uniref:DUF4817 domain-containing protein n=1 Tax=Trichonephila clavipes TaxID=2585209 RepID=A0A8X6VTD4_TRICX|nr:hypothetical protein TNCV_3297521 [Trichonephila clavipes]
MEDLTYAEKANMYYMCGRANGNGRAALRMYHARFPDRRITEYYSDMHTYLNATFAMRWIGLGAHGHPDCFLFGHLKILVYATALGSNEDLVARISEAADTSKQSALQAMTNESNFQRRSGANASFIHEVLSKFAGVEVLLREAG